MRIICEAEDYSVEEREDCAIVTNQLYSGKLCTLWLTSFLEFFIPDPSTYRIPKSIILKNISGDGTVRIDKKLNVLGTTDYEYVLISSQFEKWKRSYLVMNYLTIILSLIIFAFTLYISFADGTKWYCLVVSAIVAIFPIILVRRTVGELSAAGKLRKVEM